MNFRMKRALCLVFILFTYPCISQAYASMNPNDLLDYSIDLYEDKRYENAADSFSMLVKSRDFRRLDHNEKFIALELLVYSLANQDKARQAVPYSKQLQKVTKSGFGKRSREFAEALYVEAIVQYRIGDERDASRTMYDVAGIYENLGSEYKKEYHEAMQISGKLKFKEWDDKKLPKDLSDFFTTCEEIVADEKLPAVTRRFSDYKLVGRDYKPKGKERRFFKETYIKRARESSTDRANRLVFIPDYEHINDWCVVYPSGTLVDRAVIVPNEKDS